MSGTWATMISKQGNGRSPWTVRYEVEGKRREKSFKTRKGRRG